MPKIEKKWGAVIGAYNLASQIVQNAETQLQKNSQLEKNEKSKQEIKAQLEENAKMKPILTELSRVFKEFALHLQKYADEHTQYVGDINIDNALETEISPASGDKPAIKKIVLNERGEYCYDRVGEKNRISALRELNEKTVFVEQFEIATTLTEKADIFEGLLLYKSGAKNRPPLKSVKR